MQKGWELKTSSKTNCNTQCLLNLERTTMKCEATGAKMRKQASFSSRESAAPLPGKNSSAHHHPRARIIPWALEPRSPGGHNAREGHTGTRASSFACVWSLFPTRIEFRAGKTCLFSSCCDPLLGST